MRILVCGGRDFTDYDLLCATLTHHQPTLIIHGAAQGADSLADDWAREAGCPTSPFPADWATHGRAAGPIRNKQMLDEGHPDLVIAFPGGRGTRNCVNQARARGLRIIEIGRMVRWGATTPK